MNSGQLKSILITIFLLIFLGNDFEASAQTYRIEREWLANDGLHDVLVKRVKQQLIPTYYIYSDRAVAVADNKQVLARWADCADINLSPGRNLCGVFSAGEPPTGRKEPWKYSFIVYDADGKVIHELGGTLPNIKERPRYYLTDTRKALIACSYWGEQLLFYDRQGILLNERSLIQPENRLMINPKGAFDEFGGLFLFHPGRPRVAGEVDNPDLFMLLSTGTRFWQSQLPLQATIGIGLARHGRFAIVSGTAINSRRPQPVYQTLLFDSLGNILNSFPVGFRHSDFSRDDKWLLLGNDFNVYLVTLIKKAIYLELSPAGGRRKVTDCGLLTRNRILILTGVESSHQGETIFDDPEIVIYSTTGQILYRQIFESDYTYSGKFTFNDSRDQFGLVLQNRYIVFNTR